MKSRGATPFDRGRIPPLPPPLAIQRWKSDHDADIGVDRTGHGRSRSRPESGRRPPPRSSARHGCSPTTPPTTNAWAALTAHTLDGVPVPPLGTADRAPQPLPGARDGRQDTVGWDVRSVLVGRDAARVAEDAVAELETGATSLMLTVGGPGVTVDDIPVALSEVYLEMAPVVLDVRGDVDELAAARALVAALRGQAVAPAAGTNFGADPVGRAVRRRGGAGSRRRHRTGRRPDRPRRRERHPRPGRRRHRRPRRGCRRGRRAGLLDRARGDLPAGGRRAPGWRRPWQRRCASSATPRPPISS